MDLLTYAVKNKLSNAEDPLLAYVAKRKDIPVSIIEESFKELLRPLEDEKSSLLVEDYPKMLEKYVAVQYTRNQEDGGYDVSGEISSQLLEAIQLVHGESQEDIISGMISKSTEQITNRSVEVEKLSLTELDAKMTELVNDMPQIKQVGQLKEVDYFQKELIDDINDDLVEDVIDFVEEEFVEDEYQEEPTQEPTQEKYQEESIDEQYQEEPIEEQYQEEPIEEQYQEEPIEEPIEEQYEEQYEEVGQNNVNMTEEEYQELESRLLTEGIQRVYDKILSDLREKGLVESLGLSI